LAKNPKPILRSLLKPTSAQDFEFSHLGGKARKERLSLES